MIEESSREADPSREGQNGPRIVVIGAGLSGLTAALRASETPGVRVTLISKGHGGLRDSHGSIDVLGCAADERVWRPLEALDRTGPDHPYRLIGVDRLRDSLQYFARLVGSDLVGADSENNRCIPTAAGAWRPTLWAPASMEAAAYRADLNLVVVGIAQLRDFNAELVSANLARTAPDAIRTRAVTVSFLPRKGDLDPSALDYARALDCDARMREFAELVRSNLRPDEVVAMPALLGTHPSGWRNFERLVEHRVQEIVLQPPSVPGIRLEEALLGKIARRRVRLIMGSEVLGVASADGTIASIDYATAGRVTSMPCDVLILAPGGIESGGIVVDDRGRLSEPLLGLPIVGAEADRFDGDGRSGHERRVFECGVRVDRDMRPLDASARPVLKGLHVCGRVVAGSIPWAEKSGEGIAISSAVIAADAATELREQVVR